MYNPTRKKYNFSSKKGNNPVVWKLSTTFTYSIPVMHLNYCKAFNGFQKFRLILCSITSRVVSLKHINTDRIQTGTVFYYMHTTFIFNKLFPFYNFFLFSLERKIFRTELFDCFHPTDCEWKYSQYNVLDRLKHFFFV